jgi:hypothetical protein
MPERSPLTLYSKSLTCVSGCSRRPRLMAGSQSTWAAGTLWTMWPALTPLMGSFISTGGDYHSPSFCPLFYIGPWTLSVLCNSLHNGAVLGLTEQILNQLKGKCTDISFFPLGGLW